MHRQIIALALAAVGAPMARAQAPAEFCSDRPGLTTGVCTAAAGTFQLETSFVEWARSRGREELSLGSSRLRYGIDRRTDLHLAIVPYTQIRLDQSNDGMVRGHGDLSIALKHVVTPADAPIAVAVMPFVKLPTGSRSVSNRRWEGGLIVPIEAALSGPFSVTLTPELDWNADQGGDGHRPRLALAATLGLALSERWGASLDGMIAREADSGGVTREAAVSGSLAFLASATVQLDAQVDLGLTRDLPGIRLTSGIVLRF